MDLIKDLLKRVTEFNNGLESGTYLFDVVLENQDFIIDMNATSQLYELGVNNLGVDIIDYKPYADYTIDVKRALGQPYTRVTLHDEGDFAGSFYLDINKERFEFKASDFKTVDLMAKYGRQILGLTEQSQQELVFDYIYPYLVEQRNKLIYGKK